MLTDDVKRLLHKGDEETGPVTSLTDTQFYKHQQRIALRQTPMHPVWATEMFFKSRFWTSSRKAVSTGGPRTCVWCTPTGGTDRHLPWIPRTCGTSWAG